MLLLCFLISLISKSVQFWLDETSLVVNGEAADIREFPFMVGLYYQGHYTCGASIYNNQWVMTAAHCLYDENGMKRDFTKYSVHAGSSELNQGIEVPVCKVVVNPSFNYLTLSDDIAMLKLKSTLTFSDKVKEVTLPLSHQSVKSGTPAVLLGWGFSKDGGTPMENLQKATIEILDQNKCETIYKKNKHKIHSSNICAMHQGGGTGQCTGDSGGPLVQLDQKVYTQVGIVSFSEKPCANKLYPGVFSKVSYYVEWMKTVTSS